MKVKNFYWSSVSAFYCLTLVFGCNTIVEERLDQELVPYNKVSLSDTINITIEANSCCIYSLDSNSYSSLKLISKVIQTNQAEELCAGCSYKIVYSFKGIKSGTDTVKFYSSPMSDSLKSSSIIKVIEVL